MGKLKKSNLSGSLWKDILFEVYSYAPNSYEWSSKVNFSNDDNPIAKKLGVEGSDVVSGIAFLKKTGLIEILSITEVKNRHIINLTEKGFNVALDLEKHGASLNTQQGILIISSLFFFISLLNVLVGSVLKLWVYLVLFVIIVSGFSFMMTSFFKTSYF